MKQLLRALRERPHGAGKPLAPLVLSTTVLQLQLCQGAAAVGQAAAASPPGGQEAALAGYLGEVWLVSGACWFKLNRR